MRCRPARRWCWQSAAGSAWKSCATAPPRRPRRRRRSSPMPPRSGHPRSPRVGIGPRQDRIPCSRSRTRICAMLRASCPRASRAKPNSRGGSSARRGGPRLTQRLRSTVHRAHPRRLRRGVPLGPRMAGAHRTAPGAHARHALCRVRTLLRGPDGVHRTPLGVRSGGTGVRHGGVSPGSHHRWIRSACPTDMCYG